jgi:hypothetical protein
VTISASSTLMVADQTPVTVSASTVVLAASAPPMSPGGPGSPLPSGSGVYPGGRLVHPSLGTYDYPATPTETVNVLGGVIVPPIWSHAMTLGGGIDTLWPGFKRDARVIERWIHGASGGPIAHLIALLNFWQNPPDPTTPSYVVWSPSYATTASYNVAIVAVRSGGQEITIDQRLRRYGYAPSPVELELRIFGDA